MASASFTLRAVDATKAAFAGVQNSLNKLEAKTASISKITKLAFGGEAILGSLTMMKGRIDKVVSAGEEMGFSDEQIASAMMMERKIENVLNMLMRLPLALGTIGEKLLDAFSPLTENEIAERIKNLRLDRFKKEIDSTTDSTRKLQNQFDVLLKSEGQLADEMRGVSENMFKEAVALFEQGNLAAGFKKQEEALAKLLEVKTLDASVTQRMTDAQDELNKALPESQRVGQSQAQLLEGLQQRYADLTFKLSEQNIAYKSYKELGGPVATTQENIIRLTKEQAAVSAQLNKLLENQNLFATQAGEATAMAFEDAIFSGQKLSEVVRSLGLDLARMMFQQQVTARLAGGFGSLFSGGTFMAGFGGPKAMGGPVSGGKSYLVGEEGPELFVPNASGTIVPNNKMGSGGGGAGGVTINYNIASGVSRAELVPILDQERRRLKAEIPDMVRRGGAYRAAFA
jgi:hypothetical protein